jgi:cytochrome b561
MTSAVAAGFALPVYKPTLRWLHWGIAVLIFAAIALGVSAIYMPRGDVRTEVVTIHKAIGITVLFLVVLRVLARVSLGAPKYFPPLDFFTRYASELGHLALYALMFAMPISGYVDQTADGHPISWFGLFTFPMLIPHDPALSKQASEAHYIFAWCIGAMLVAHIGAALWHALVRKDNVLARMWPRLRGA